MGTVQVFVLDTDTFDTRTANANDTIAVGLHKSLGIGGVANDGGLARAINYADPTAAGDLVTKRYADAMFQGGRLKAPALLLADSPIGTYSGFPTIDGGTPVEGSRVVLTAETNAVRNGLWVTHSGAWTRPADYFTGASAAATIVTVEEGSVYADDTWLCITDPGSDVVDTNATSWQYLNGLGQVSVGNGLAKTGNTLYAVLATQSGLQFTAGKLDTQVDPNAGLNKGTNGLGLLLNGATLQVGASGVSVKGVPLGFAIGGTATNSSVTAGALGTLTGGIGSAADALHTHNQVSGATSLQEALVNGSAALAKGDPVAFSTTANTLARADAAGGSDLLAQCIGVAAAATAASATATVIKLGPAPGVLSGASVGLPVYLAPGGGLTQMRPSTAGQYVVRLGFARSATDLEVAPRYVIKN